MENDEKLVVQKSRRQLQSSETVRRFRKRKSCCHVIAIPQAGIAAPTLTVMQGFEAKKKYCSVHFLFLVLSIASILQILPFYAFVTQVRIELGCDGWKANALTTTQHQLQQCNDKMLYLNQMYEKKAMEGYA